MLRPARPGDEGAVQRLVRGCLEEHGLGFYPEDVDRDLADLATAYPAPDSFFGVLEEDGRIYGSVGILRHDASTCELRKMYLAPERRGSGRGRALLAAALAFAREHGYRRVVLETSSKLEAAIRLYERAGFRPEQGVTCDRCDLRYFIDLTPAPKA
ncbi:MAG: GNAT family N-acetyltransferase [Planctomycetes bacterium]|nr:GNAT family N-acetyltransferase [Planctomycetota bacterium]